MLLCCLLTACFGPAKPVPDKLVLKPTSFGALAGWEDDRFSEALPVFLRSCAKLPEGSSASGSLIEKITINASDWQESCDAALAMEGKPDSEIRQFFESQFMPFEVWNNDTREGLFTGYHEIDLTGNWQPSERYKVPLYKNVKDTPSYDRKAIDAGALTGRGQELLYVDDPVKAFFLHIQGSGRVLLEDGQVVRVGYAGQNGYPYVAIGRTLIEQGEIEKKDMSARAIKSWLYAHPDQAQAMMENNPSYVFFRQIEGEGPIGAEGVPLTSERSLAVDKRFMAYGLPIWLETDYPETPAYSPVPFRKLLITQDTGGAIRGPVRGDVFFGNGDKAEMLAEYMKNTGRYSVLLPVPLARRIAGLDKGNAYVR